MFLRPNARGARVRVRPFGPLGPNARGAGRCDDTMRWRLFVVMGLMGVGAACGQQSLEDELARHPAGVLPRGATQIAWARMDRLRGDPLAALAYEKGRALPWGQTFEGVARTLESCGELSRLALGTYGTGARAAATIVVATGRFDAAAFRDRLQKANVPFVEGTYGEETFYTCGRGNERSFVCFPSAGLVVVASQEALLKETLDLRRSAKKSMARDNGFAPLLKGFSPDLDLWVTGIFPEPFLASLAATISPAVQAIQAFTLTLSGDEPRHWRFALLCLSGETARANAEVLKTLVAIVPLQLARAGYAIPQLEAVIGDGEIVVDGQTADLRLSVARNAAAAITTAFRQGPTAPPVEAMPLGDVPLPLPGALAPVEPAPRQPEGNE